MMRYLSKKTFPIILVGALGAVALYVIASQVDIVSKFKLHTAVDDLVHGRDLERAMNTLQHETPRGPTIEALKEALDGDGTPWGKYSTLYLLGQFKEQRVIGRAIDSDVVSTRRAAAYLRQGDPDVREQVGEIALAWLRDEDAADRQLAPMILRGIDRKDAVPDLVAVLRKDGAKPEASRLIAQILGALAHFRPEGISADVMKLAKNPDLEARVRAEAFTLLTVLDEGSDEERKKLLIEVAGDTGAPIHVRNGAVSQLGHKKNASEEGWQVLKDIVFDETLAKGKKNYEAWTFQRTALRALVRSYPIDRLPGFFLDRRVYTHPYFGIRTDVAVALGNLKNQIVAQKDEYGRLALGVLADLMEDHDPGDFPDILPRESWLAFWKLCGTVIIPDEFKDRRALFLRPPTPLEEEELLRAYLLAVAPNQRISDKQVKALDFCAVTHDEAQSRSDDLDKFAQRKKSTRKYALQVAQTMRNHIEACGQHWENAEKDAAKKDAGAGAPTKKADEQAPDEGKPGEDEPGEPEDEKKTEDD